MIRKCFTLFLLILTFAGITSRSVAGHEAAEEIAACANSATPMAMTSPTAAGLKIVASTSWAAAFAVAAGATDVTTIAPADLQHPPDYEPKPSDLLAVADADYVLFAGFEGFAARMQEAVGSSADKLIVVSLDNNPEVIRSEVSRLGELFGTEDVAAANLARFDAEYACLADVVQTAIGENKPTAVSQLFVASWAAMAGIEVVGTFGPEPLTPGKVAELAALQPGVVIVNAHMAGGEEISDAAGAKTLVLINFPGDDFDLLQVFRENAKLLIEAFQS